MDHSIGELARQAAVTVKTVRYCSDLGLPESRRTAAGHRRYDVDAVARLELIRSLRTPATGYRAIVADAPLRHDLGLPDRLIELRRTEADPRWHRYLELIAVVNGWAAPSGPSRIAG